MALIDCPECEKKISDKAMSCPKCGVTPPVTCVGCGKQFNGKAKACTQCGYPRKETEYLLYATAIIASFFLLFVLYFVVELIV